MSGLTRQVVGQRIIVRWGKIASLIFLLGVWFLFLWRFFLKGLLPIPADIIAGMYYPWLDYKWGYKVGVPVRNPILSDTVSQFWIWRNWAVEQLKQGKVAIWNPYSLAGYPLSPWFHTILFSPANIFYFLTDKLTAMGLIVSFQLLLALVFMFLFLDDLTQSKLAAIFGSLSFSFSAFFIGWLTWGTVGWVASFLPLILWSIGSLARYGYQAKYLCLFVFSLLFSLLGGHPQTFLYVLVVLFVYLFWLRFKLLLSNKDVALIFSLVLLTFLLAAPAILPSIEIVRFSIRALDSHIAEVNYGFLPPVKLLILLFAPNFFGNPASGNYWGGGYNFHEYLAWFGSAALILASFSFWNFIFSRENFAKEYFAFVLIFLFGIFLSLKYPFGFLIYKLKVPFLSTASASRALFLTAFAGAALGSFGLDSLLRRKVKKKVARYSFFSFLVIAGGIFFGLIISYLVFKQRLLSEDLVYAKKFLGNFKVAFRNLVVPVSSAGLASLLIVLAGYLNFTGWRLRLAAFGLILTALAEGFYFGWRYTPFVPRHLYFPQTPVIKFLEDKYQGAGDFFRIERQRGEILPANMWMSFGFFSPSGYDPVYPRSYADFLKEKGFRDGYSRYLDLSGDEAALDYLGVRYFLVLKRDQRGRTSPTGEIPYWINRKKWRVVFEDKSVAVLENQEFSPPYLVIDKNGQKQEAGIILLKKGDDFWQFKAQAPKEGLFVLRENYFPGWKVRVDGEEKGVQVVEGTFKGVKIPPGSHQIEFRYSNYWLKLGAIGSLAFFCFLLLIFFSEILDKILIGGVQVK